MTQEINTATSGQVIPFKEASKAPQTKASRDKSVADVGEVIAADKALTASSNVSKTEDPLDRAAEILNKILPSSDMQNTRLRINKDDNTGDFVYQTLDNDTGEVIRQFPPETIMEMLSKIREVEGLAIDKLA